MNIERLYKILGETTIQLRKGEAVTRETKGNIDVTEIFMMPHDSEGSDDLIRVDMEFLIIGVDKDLAEKHRAEFIDILNHYPDPDTLAGGPSYITVGAEIGDQGAAFQMFALGKALGLWDVITPGSMGFTGPEAADMAGRGFVMISGYRPAS